MRSRGDLSIQRKSQRLGKHGSGEEGPELIGILDHSTHTSEFSTRRTMKGLYEGKKISFVLGSKKITLAAG